MVLRSWTNLGPEDVASPHMRQNLDRTLAHISKTNVSGAMYDIKDI